MIYRRGNLYWYSFVFHGKRIRESTGTSDPREARALEAARKRELAEAGAAAKSPLFGVAARRYIDLKRHLVRPRTLIAEEASIKHLMPWFGRRPIALIAPDDIARYQQHRLDEGAAPKTVNLEVGTLRGILRRHRLWHELQPDVRLLPVADDKGRSLTAAEQQALLEAASRSRSPSFYPAICLMLATGMRLSEVRLLRWLQVDLERGLLTVGTSKTEAGTGRVVPLNRDALETLRWWADHFPARQPQECLFPALKMHRAASKGPGWTPTKAVSGWKTAWRGACRRAGVACRIHDLRHTAASKMLEAGVPIPVVAALLGWSPATSARMARRYGHMSNPALRQAVQVLEQVWSPQPPPRPNVEAGPKPLEPDGSSARTRTWNPSVNS